MTAARKEIDYEDGLRLVSKLLGRQRYEAAVRWADHLCRHRPGDPRAHNQAGMARQRQAGPGAAVRSFQRAVVLQPDVAEIWANLGNAMRRAANPGGALAQHLRAATCRPEVPEIRSTLGLSLLTLGDYRRGFAEHEHRAEREIALQPYRDAGFRLWDRRSLQGKRLLVVAEQGAGDTVQFLRFVAPLAARGAIVSVASSKLLRRLVGTAPGVAETVARWPIPQPGEYDGIELLMSLPACLGADLEIIPAPARYISPPPATAPLPDRGRLRVGLCWTGSPAHPRNEPRRIPFAELDPLLATTGVEFYGLQVGFGRADAAGDTRITDLAPGIADFADTAGAIDQLDLMITIDTSVAHIAGALGKPVWTLLARAADWRWGADGDTCRWYPSMRLFRQSRMGEWRDVVDRVAAELAVEVAAREAGSLTRRPRFQAF